jgi:alkylation response protein AidB-like acyl-CoA dehydrogenase
LAEDDVRLGLTELSEDEQMFQSSVRQFAAERVQPLVRAMDEAQQMDPALVREMFALGLMGLVVPEELGGAGGSFFDAVLAVEAISAVDPAVGVLVDVQNTLCANALVRWGSAEQKQRYLPRLATEMVGAYALSEAKSGSDAFALGTRRRPGCLSSLPPSILRRDTKV